MREKLFSKGLFALLDNYLMEDILVLSRNKEQYNLVMKDLQEDIDDWIKNQHCLSQYCIPSFANYTLNMSPYLVFSWEDLSHRRALEAHTIVSCFQPTH